MIVPPAAHKVTALTNVTLMLHVSSLLLRLKARCCCSLVSGLAADTSQLYAEGATAVQQACQGMPVPKAALYAQWKAAAFSAYLHAFAGGCRQSSAELCCDPQQHLFLVVRDTWSVTQVFRGIYPRRHKPAWGVGGAPQPSLWQPLCQP